MEHPGRSPRQHLYRLRLRELKEVMRFIIDNGAIALQEADWLRDPNRFTDFNTPLALIARGEWKRAARAYCEEVGEPPPSIFREGKE
jgi:hypothetical protein